jgi:hypothetical protein
MNTRKTMAWVVSGSLVVAVGIYEARENPHIEGRQYEEPSRLSYEFPNSTATMTMLGSLLPEDFYAPTQLKR